MEFVMFNKRFQENFEKLYKDSGRLYFVDLDKDKLWDLYLDNFPEGTNPLFRKRREYDCSCCRSFVKHIGNVVGIVGNEIKTVWDFDAKSPVFQPSINAMNEYVREFAINSTFLSADRRIGTEYNYEKFENGEMHKWDHFFLNVSKYPAIYVTNRSIEELQGQARDDKNVFLRSLEDISMEAIDVVLDLIGSNSLYRGSENKAMIQTFRKCKEEYQEICNDPTKVEAYAWRKSFEIGSAFSRIKNHSIGILLSDISSDMNLEDAVNKYERMVAPENYKRTNAIFTKKMLADAQKKIEEMGYMDSLGRRFATLDDINVRDILFVDRDSKPSLDESKNVFEEMMHETKNTPRKFNRAETIEIDKFIADVLPHASAIEAYIDNKNCSNFVSLIAPKNLNSKTMFKWNNGFSWAYRGNMTDSSIKTNVKNAGGKVEGVLRFSIQWNDTDALDANDLDAHCMTPRDHIYFSHKGSMTGGSLDVDIIHPRRNVPAVENIVWENKNRMAPGKYEFFVHCFSNRSGRSGFRAEIEFDGNTYSYDYQKPVRQSQNVAVADVIVDNNGNFKIVHHLDSNVTSKDVWGLRTNEFVPVSVIMNSPNYWDNQNGIGNKHYFFMLKGCRSDEEPNGFYVEFLNQDLFGHRKVLEALGSKMAVSSCENQLSGLGFSSTKRAELTVKVIGATERIMTIKF